MDNPYSLIFGKEPLQFISRIAQTEEIYHSFTSDHSSQQIYMVTGIRGSGKTVFMTELSKRLAKEKNWVVIELNPAKDLLQGFAAKLYNQKGFPEIFKKAEINLSFFGIGIDFAGSSPITDIEVAITRMMEGLAKHGKRVLITIDEVVSDANMKVFASAFQIFIRQDLPLYLIMTGLYENIEVLQNVKILTFLHRAPKMRLAPLDMGSICDNYKANFHCEDNAAREMAHLTRGYPFAFQVLGYYTFQNNGDYKAALSAVRQYIAEYVYAKIWSELSKNDKRVLYAMVQSPKISEIRKQLGMETNELSPYRDRLIKKGLINGDERGYVRFVLPFFEEYVMDNYENWEPSTVPRTK